MRSSLLVVEKPKTDGYGFGIYGRDYLGHYCGTY